MTADALKVEGDDDRFLVGRLAEAEEELRLERDHVISLVLSCACDAAVDEAVARERRLKHRAEAFQTVLARTLAVDFIEKREDQTPRALSISKNWITLKEAAFATGFCVESIRSWCAKREVTAQRHGGRWLVDLASVKKRAHR
jgi:hypothetical protein